MDFRVFTKTAILLAAILWTLGFNPGVADEVDKGVKSEKSSEMKYAEEQFRADVESFFKNHCVRCHNVDKRESGVRVDHLSSSLEDSTLKLWEVVERLIEDGEMPPAEEPQPSEEERQRVLQWISKGVEWAKLREEPRNGIARRLTVAQYANTISDLLGIQDNLTSLLPPDGVSKDGFSNNTQMLQLSPLQLEAYFTIAEKALDSVLVKDSQPPPIQMFRMDLGKGINSQPCPDNLILGANNHLLANADFVVTELSPEKPFAYQSFRMQTKWKFIEGYAGNDTVRGWRDFDSIYHSVFACMRGNEGYPKGLAYQTVPRGLLLRPAIPSREIFGESSTYGPQANFKISLRELPDNGNFRVRVKAAKYDDGLLLEQGVPVAVADQQTRMLLGETSGDLKYQLSESGVYQVDVLLHQAIKREGKPDTSRLNEGLIGYWSFDENWRAYQNEVIAEGIAKEGAERVASPFGKALSVDGSRGTLDIPRHESMSVSDGEFTVAAWIHPSELRQGGIASLGGYGYTHGWLLDMPGSNGVLRLETADKNGAHNGTVQTAPNTLRVNTWQHVAAVVKRGDKATKLYVNGYEVAKGTIGDADLDNPSVSLLIGRIRNAQFFWGEIDELRLYRRALGANEIEALVEPGRKFAQMPSVDSSQRLDLQIGEREFSGRLDQPAFLAVRLTEKEGMIRVRYSGSTAVEEVILTKLSEDHPVYKSFVAFEKRDPWVGAHVGLRRDCGSTLNPVGGPQRVQGTELREYVFEGAINNFPRPEVEKDNVNYLAGIREIGVRSEYTDGRDIPRLMIASIEFEGPYFESWPPKNHQDIMLGRQDGEDEEAYATRILRSFATRAFRRPVSDEELALLMSTFRATRGTGQEFQDSIRSVLTVILSSPQFLFLVEQSQGPEAEDLDDWELASKLSYFLWNSPPDEQLLRLAKEGSLRRNLDEEVERLIVDPRFERFINVFAAQWLSVDKFDVVNTDEKRFPKLTRDAKRQLREEPAMFLSYLVKNNLPMESLIRSDWIVANDVIATYYGVEGTENGFEFAPIVHRREDLGGVLTQVAILAGLSDGREANPVKRGAWLARKIIADPPDDPPPNVPVLEDLTQLTLREKLEKHRNVKGCASCHEGIDPWGIPFEEFDAGGRRIEKAVDATTTLQNGRTLVGVADLKAYLSSDMLDQVAFSFANHMAIYANGRTLSYRENLNLKEELGRLRSEKYGIRDIIHLIVRSESFLKK
ncbi:MAG: hypothetical protein RLY14_2778 [Planctomycetota bacterium]|jgi:mono/diheme cytochrome c family protein